MDYVLQVILTALYLRGAPRSYDVKRCGWQSVERSLRLRIPKLTEADDALRSDGLWAEALALTTPGLLAWAEQQIEARRVLTAVHPGYLPRCLERLGPSCPPAVWIEGELPDKPFVTIIGSRNVGQPERRFAARCAAQAVELGYAVASGGARGCDRAAAQGVLGTRRPGALIEVLPYGLKLASGFGSTCRISVCAPDEDFSRGTAMERNGLLYALSEAAVIVHARFKSGGTWHGAIDAHRRGLSKLVVRDDPANEAHLALAALGAACIERPEGLRAILCPCPSSSTPNEPSPLPG